MSLFSVNFVMANEKLPTCINYGCADCSCIANNPEIFKKMPEVLSKIKELLAKDGVPPEAVNISLKGYKGEEATELTPLTDKTVAKCCCGCGAPNCVWEFSGPEKASNKK